MTRQKIINITLFLLRIAVAIVFIQAGGVKLFGWFGGMPEGVPMTTLITVAGYLEVFGGALFLLGLFTRPVAFILSGEMAFAYFLGHFPQGVWPIQNHGEAAFLLCFIFLFFAAYGAGSISIDRFIKSRKQIVPVA
jgi:putative oxidoreductase